METLLLGFSGAFTPINLAYCFAGVFLGTVIGVLPGVGASAAVAPPSGARRGGSLCHDHRFVRGRVHRHPPDDLSHTPPLLEYQLRPRRIWSS